MSTLGERLVAAAKTQVGKPYIWGGTGPSGFDCSGLVTWAAKQFGIKGLPRTSQAMRNAGTPVPVSQIAVGDLVTFTYRDRRGDNPGPGNHVAIYAGNGQVVQASGSRVNVGPLDVKFIDRVIRLPGGGGTVQVGAGDATSGGVLGSVRRVVTMQQAGYAAAPDISSYGAPTNPFKMPGWIAAGGSEGASSPGGVEQAALGGIGGSSSVPWDGVSTVILSSLFVLGGLALVVGGLAVSIRSGAAA